MEIGHTIVKTLIVVLEGCVVKLKELEAYLDEKKKNSDSVSYIESTTSSQHLDGVEKFSTENYYNISYLDQYVQSLGLPIGSSFMKIIQRTELKTEYNLIETMLGSLSDDMANFEAVYNNIKESKSVVFQYIKPSPLRNEEQKVVDKKIVCEELIENGLLYDEKKSLYDNSLRVIELKQKQVMNEIVKRFDTTIERIYDNSDYAYKEKLIQVLVKELNDRKKILELKLKR